MVVSASLLVAPGVWDDEEEAAPPSEVEDSDGELIVVDHSGSGDSE